MIDSRLCHFLCFDEKRGKVFVNDALKFPAFHDAKAKESTRWFFFCHEFLNYETIVTREKDVSKQTDRRLLRHESLMLETNLMFFCWTLTQSRLNFTPSIVWFMTQVLCFHSTLMPEIHFSKQTNVFVFARLVFKTSRAHMLQIMMSAAECCKKQRR